MYIIYLPLNIRNLLYTGLVTVLYGQRKYKPAKVIILTQKIDKEFISVGFHETVLLCIFFNENNFIYVKFSTETIYQQKINIQNRCTALVLIKLETTRCGSLFLYVTWTASYFKHFPFFNYITIFQNTTPKCFLIKRSSFLMILWIIKYHLTVWRLIDRMYYTLEGPSLP